MTPQIRSKVEEYKDKYLKECKKILEIGSLDINGGVRDLFKDTEYIGIDMQEGKGVDIVMNAHDIKKRFKRGEFDCVICLETLEHDNLFWITLENIKYVLKFGGFLVVSTPTFGFPLHRYPKDYYRFGEDFYREVLFDPSEYRLLELDFVKDFDGNEGIVAIGQKFPVRKYSDEEIEGFLKFDKEETERLDKEGII